MTGARAGARRRLSGLAALAMLCLPVPPAAAATTAPGQAHAPSTVAPAHRSDQPGSGLTVSIDSLSPAYLRPGQPVRVQGSISNLDDHVWRDLLVYLVMSPSPLTTRDQLRAALDSPATSYSGNRITDPGLYVDLGSLQPGESVSYQLSVPFRHLGLLAPISGIYPFGVHVIATDQNGYRDITEATGRARSLIPLLPRDAPPVNLSLVWPLQFPLQRAADGTYRNADDLVNSFGAGHLREMLDMALAAGDMPLTVVVDPALVDAASHLTSATFGPASLAGSGAPSPGTGGSSPPQESAEQRSASGFLQDVRALAASQTLYLEQYGRPDLSALAQRPRSGLARTVNQATSSATAQLGLSGPLAYLPAARIGPPALSALPSGMLPIVSATQVDGWSPEAGPVSVLESDPTPLAVVVTDKSLTDGGPTPGPTDTALQVRQRLLSEAALLSMEATASGVSDAGLVFVAAPSWDPGPLWPAAGFFSGLSAPWLNVTSLDAQLVRGPYESSVRLAPAHAHGAGLPSGLLEAVQTLQRRSRLLTAVTGADHVARSFYDQAVALALSEYWRRDLAEDQSLVDDTVAAVTAQLTGISVEGPDVVTLSSASGRFPLTITNNLDHPVRVGVRITADTPGLKFDSIGPVELRRNESTTFTVGTSARSVGVTQVSARLTTPGGRPFGRATSFSLRTSVVGVVVWIALGVAGGLVVLSIARRIRRQRRGSVSPPAPPAVRTAP